MARIAKSSNPYRPSWGAPPPVLAGRDEQLDEAMEALEAGPRHPVFCHVYYGDRGCGKTVLLDALADRSRARGWPTIALACREGTPLTDALVELHLPEVLRSLTRRRGQRATKEVRGSVGVPGIARVSAGASWAPAETSRGVELERLLTEVGEAAARRDVRVLLTVDELHTIDRRFDLPTWPACCSWSPNGEACRSRSSVPGSPRWSTCWPAPRSPSSNGCASSSSATSTTDATRYALLGPAQAAGVTFELEALELLTRASSGYPYYVQLLGWETWAAAAAAGASSIDAGHARAGVRGAEVVVVEQVLEPRFRRLAPREQAYLTAMAVDGDGGTTTADLVARLGATSASDLSYLRERLLAKHMIRAAGRGRVAFTLPGMAAWLGAGTPRRSLPPPRS